MRVLLTGAAGRLGSETYAQLKAAGIDVRATDISRRRDMPGPVRVVDLLNREAAYELVDGVDAVIHVANHSHARSATAQRVLSENVAMNMNVFQSAVESGVGKILYASSIQAMAGSRTFDSGNGRAEVPYLPLDGNIPQHPGNPYALSKCFGEQQLRYFVEQKMLASAIAVRFPLLLARERFASWRARAGGAPMLAQNTLTDEGFSWLSYTDAAKLLCAALKAELPGYRCYLPASPQPRQGYTVREIIERYMQGAELRKPIDQIDAIVDVRGITSDTGWKPQEKLWEAPGSAPAASGQGDR